jgi:hypothetical protein
MPQIPQGLKPIAETIYDICPGMHAWLVWLIFICLFIGLYCAGFWALVDRPVELDRKFPTSSKELRRRKKGLYDWLDSLTRTTLVPAPPTSRKARDVRHRVFLTG